MSVMWDHIEMEETTDGLAGRLRTSMSRSSLGHDLKGHMLAQGKGE